MYILVPVQADFVILGFLALQQKPAECFDFVQLQIFQWKFNQTNLLVENKHGWFINFE